MFFDSYFESMKPEFDLAPLIKHELSNNCAIFVFNELENN